MPCGSSEPLGGVELGDTGSAVPSETPSDMENARRCPQCKQLVRERCDQTTALVLETPRKRLFARLLPKRGRRGGP